MMARLLVLTICSLCAYASASAQTLRFPDEVVVVEEVYQECTLVHQRQLLRIEKHPELARRLVELNRYSDTEESAAMVREFLIENIPETVYVKIQIGECGTPL